MTKYGSGYSSGGSGYTSSQRTSSLRRPDSQDEFEQRKGFGTASSKRDDPLLPFNSSIRNRVTEKDNTTKYLVDLHLFAA